MRLYIKDSSLIAQWFLTDANKPCGENDGAKSRYLELPNTARMTF
jgi:hypothetical protein